MTADGGIMRIRTAALIGAVTLALAGCADGSAGSAGSVSTAGTATPPTPSVSIVDPDAAFYIHTLRDWKDYGDAIVTVHVDSDRVDPSTPKDPDVNGGLIGRQADFRVTHTFWTRDAAHQPPTTFAALMWGWWDKDGNPRMPIASKGDPRYLPGHDYLVVLDRFRDGWTPAIGMPFDGGTAGTGEWLGRADPVESGINQLLGKDEAGVQQLLDSVQLSPTSRKYSARTPEDRAQKLLLAHH
jgi:hypothetical protein